MTIPDIVKGPEKKPPRTLEEAASNTLANIAEQKGSFDDKLRKTLEARNALHGVEGVLHDILRGGTEFMEEAAQLLKELKVKPEDVDAHLAKIRAKRDRSLYKRDFSKMAAFHRDVLELKGGDDESGKTEYQVKEVMQKRLMDSIKSKRPEFEKYITPAEILEMLNVDGETTDDQVDEICVKLRQKIEGRIDADTAIEEDEKDNLVRFLLDSRLREIVDDIVVFQGMVKLVPVSTFSEVALPAIFGRVLPEAEMDKVFENDFTPIIDLPDGNVRLVFADGVADFYHEKGKDDIRDDLKKKTTGTLPRRVLMVHYHTDEDMSKFWGTLTKGHTVSGKARSDASQIIEIEGRGDSSEVVVKNAPKDTDAKDLMAHPMKYFRPDIEIQTPEKTA